MIIIKLLRKLTVFALMILAGLFFGAAAIASLVIAGPVAMLFGVLYGVRFIYEISFIAFKRYKVR